MPSAGLLALLDDITSLLDDVAAMTKVATKKTAAVIGDDLALNANQLTGMSAARELPIVYAVAKGSLLNKLILIPTALFITVVAAWLVYPLLMIGGAFLCYEGVEKLVHKAFHHGKEEPGDDHVEHHLEPEGTALDPASMEKDRIRGAIFTDFILSAEILVIALGAASEATFAVRALTLCAIGLGMTVLVYGSVALIVKADDAGVHLQTVRGRSLGARLRRALGKGLVAGAPKLMKLLSILGTAAMFLVGGEIVAHGVPAVELTFTQLASSVGGPFSGVVKLLCILVFGVVVGAVILGTKKAVQGIVKSRGNRA